MLTGRVSVPVLGVPFVPSVVGPVTVTVAPTRLLDPDPADAPEAW